MKLSYKDKIQLYKHRKEGFSYKTLSLKYGVTLCYTQYLISLIDRHGYGVLRTNKNNCYSPSFKENAINRVLINKESIWEVSLDSGLLSRSTLMNWIRKYEENGYNVVEKKKGRPSTMINNQEDIIENETLKEKVKRLEEENKHLKAQIEYSKKLKAVVQTRKNQQQKKR